MGEAQDCSKSCSTQTVSTNTARGDPCIKQIQAILNLQADGIFGPKTQAAVQAFQASHGLTKDGIVGPRTWAELLQACGDTKASLSSARCTPTNIVLPKWSGGKQDQLACAVKDLAMQMGMGQKEQWAYIMATGES